LEREEVKEKLDYMHANPVMRKLVLHPKDWPWSSWSHYARGEQGLLRIDSFGDGSRVLGRAKGEKVQEPHP
jgi:hypothetical protein